MRQTTSDSALTIRQHPAMASALQSNVTAVTAIVKKIIPMGTLNFRLTISISQVSAQGEAPSFAEAGQEITVTPQYFLSDGGTIDTMVERNKKLLSLKAMNPGDTFQGMISLTSTGQWMLVEVIN